MLKSLLVLEESAAVQGLIASALGDSALSVYQEPHAERFLSTAQKVMPDVILLSNNEQKLGYPTCRKIKADSKLAKIPIVLLANARDQLDNAQLKKLGISGFVRKPFEASSLQKQIQQYLPTAFPKEISEAYAEAQSFQEETPGNEEEIDVFDGEMLDVMAPVPPNAPRHTPDEVPDIDFSQEIEALELEAEEEAASVPTRGIHSERALALSALGAGLENIAPEEFEELELEEIELSSSETDAPEVWEAESLGQADLEELEISEEASSFPPTETIKLSEMLAQEEAFDEISLHDSDEEAEGLALDEEEEAALSLSEPEMALTEADPLELEEENLAEEAGLELGEIELTAEDPEDDEEGLRLSEEEADLLMQDEEAIPELDFNDEEELEIILQDEESNEFELEEEGEDLYAETNAPSIKPTALSAMSLEDQLASQAAQNFEDDFILEEFAEGVPEDLAAGDEIVLAQEEESFELPSNEYQEENEVAFPLEETNEDVTLLEDEAEETSHFGEIPEMSETHEPDLVEALAAEEFDLNDLPGGDLDLETEAEFALSEEPLLETEEEGLEASLIDEEELSLASEAEDIIELEDPSSDQEDVFLTEVMEEESLEFSESPLELEEPLLDETALLDEEAPELLEEIVEPGELIPPALSSPTRSDHSSHDWDDHFILGAEEAHAPIEDAEDQVLPALLMENAFAEEENQEETQEAFSDEESFLDDSGLPRDGHRILPLHFDDEEQHLREDLHPIQLEVNDFTEEVEEDEDDLPTKDQSLREGMQDIALDLNDFEAETPSLLSSRSEEDEEEALFLEAEEPSLSPLNEDALLDDVAAFEADHESDVMLTPEELDAVVLAMNEADHAQHLSHPLDEQLLTEDTSIAQSLPEEEEPLTFNFSIQEELLESLPLIEKEDSSHLAQAFATAFREENQQEAPEFEAFALAEESEDIDLSEEDFSLAESPEEEFLSESEAVLAVETESPLEALVSEDVFEEELGLEADPHEEMLAEPALAETESIFEADLEIPEEIEPGEEASVEAMAQEALEELQELNQELESLEMKDYDLEMAMEHEEEGLGGMASFHDELDEVPQEGTTFASSAMPKVSIDVAPRLASKPSQEDAMNTASSAFQEIGASLALSDHDFSPFPNGQLIMQVGEGGETPRLTQMASNPEDLSSQLGHLLSSLIDQSVRQSLQETINQSVRKTFEESMPNLVESIVKELRKKL